MSKTNKHDLLELNQRIGKAIAKQRKSKGLTQAQLAEQLDISTDAMSRMERGSIMPTIGRLMQLADILECETADFLTNNSPLLNDQIRRLNGLLQRLDNEYERENFLVIIEKMLDWHLSNHS